VSEVAGRIPEESYERVLLAFALHLQDLSGASPGAPVVAGQILFLGDTFEQQVNLDSYLVPPALSYDPNARQLEVSSIPEQADYCQAIFGDSFAGSTWHVLGEWALGNFELPPAPKSGDRSEAVTMIALDLQEGVNFQDIPASNSTNMANLSRLIRQFVMVGEVGIGLEDVNCDSCASSGAPGVFTLWILAGLVLLARSRRRDLL